MPKKDNEVKKSKSVPADGSQQRGKSRPQNDKPGQGDGKDCAMMQRVKHVFKETGSIQKGTLDSLDADFYKYISTAPILIRNMRFSPILEDKVRHWIRKLIAGNYPDYASKRKRNMYLSNLLIQVKNGDLKDPFTHEPAPILPSASEVFKLKPPHDNARVAAASDTLLNPKEYLHVATRGRTYMATKILADNAGACAYIGVSVGGDEPLWITPSGQVKCLPERDDLKVKEITTRGEQAMFVESFVNKTIHSIASQRMPESERENLVEFYKYVLKKIEEAKEDVNFEFDGSKDQLLSRLLEMTKCEMETQAILPPGECTFKNVLALLEKRIRGLLSQAIKRNKEIQMISVQGNVIDEDPKLVDISSLRAYDPADDIWKTAITAEPGEFVIQSLKQHYPSCIITTLLMLLERQRQIILDQEKKTHEQLVASMKNELLLEVKNGVLKYQDAQKRHDKVMKILKQAEEARSNVEAALGMTKDPLATVGGDESNAQAKEMMINRLLVDAQRRLDTARQTALDIDDKMEEMTNSIADTRARNEEANKKLKKDALKWSQIICQMKADLKAQEKQIVSLKRIKESVRTQKQGCVY